MILLKSMGWIIWFLFLILVIAPLAAGEGNHDSNEPIPDSFENPPMERFDPFAGVERSGRIPKAKLPPDIKKPDRWRYVPEGRIKPGNIVDRLFVSSFIAPIFFFEQDIGAGGGVAITDIDFRQKRRREFAGAFLSYTTEGQQRYTAIWQRWRHHRELKNGGVIFEDRSFMRVSAGYRKTLTLRFYGLGADTSVDDETSYTDELVAAKFLWQQSFPDPGDSLVFQLGLSGEKHNLSEGYVSGVPSTEEIYPELFEAGDNYDMLKLHGQLRYDTRDSQHAPYRGGMLALNIEGVPLQSNDQCSAIFAFNGNWVKKVPGLFHEDGDAGEAHPPTDVIALDARLFSTQGDLPFWQLPSLGGRNTLRGYIQNRFTDEAAWHATAEYRFWIIPRGVRFTDSINIERFGGALFYDIGTVAESLEKLPRVAIHDSYGLSFRFSLERSALFRADLGFSDEGTNFTFTYGLSF
ncbi:BamA/TamA family outer membrane protein [Thermodesulfobacteriota bacterium]